MKVSLFIEASSLKFQSNLIKWQHWQAAAFFCQDKLPVQKVSLEESEECQISRTLWDHYNFQSGAGGDAEPCDIFKCYANANSCAFSLKEQLMFKANDLVEAHFRNCIFVGLKG